MTRQNSEPLLLLFFFPYQSPTMPLEVVPYPMPYHALPPLRGLQDWCQQLPNLLSAEGWAVALARPKGNLTHCAPALVIQAAQVGDLQTDHG